MKIKLGVKARDKVTGFEGIVGARVEYLNGCVRYELIPRVDKDGKSREPEYYDEARLEVISYEKAVSVKKSATGGYQPDPPRE
jgi:hypothetical protein